MLRISHVHPRRIIGLVLALVLSSAVLFGCSSAGSPQAGSDTGSQASTSSGQQAVKVEEGAEAPDFEFVGVDGSTAKLSDYRGKVVVLNFWATWCGYCMREMPDLNMVSENFDDVQVLAINRGDKPADAKAEVEELGYDFAWGLDEDRAIEALYPANGIPYTVIIDKDGIVSTVFAGSAPDMYSYLEEAVVKAGA